MKVTTTQELDLTPLKTEFKISFAWTKKRGVDKAFWFTPNGIVKIHIGSLNTSLIGTVSTETFNELIAQLKANKTEIFLSTNDNYHIGYTTTSGNSISKIINLYSILCDINLEWNARKYIENWVEDDRSLTDI